VYYLHIILLQEGRNALMLAVANNHFDCVTILLMECDADRNDVDRNGWAAQFIAARKGYWHILYALIDWGAYVDVCDKVNILCLISTHSF